MQQVTMRGFSARSSARGSNDATALPFGERRTVLRAEYDAAVAKHPCPADSQQQQHEHAGSHSSCTLPLCTSRLCQSSLRHLMRM